MVAPWSANVIWTTNEPATSQVEYGPTSSYGLVSTLDKTMVTDHWVSLTGLQPATTYHYRVRSSDACGNESISGDFTLCMSGDMTASCLLSFADARLFVNAAYGFTVCCPSKWTANRVLVADPAVLWFSDPAPSTPPFFTIVATKAADHRSALFTATKIIIEAAGGPGSYKEGSVEIMAEADAKTADGTAMKEFETQGDVLGSVLKGYNAVALKGDTYIVIAVNTVDIMSPYNKDQFAEVCRSLTFYGGIYGDILLLSPDNGTIGVPVRPASFFWSPFKETTKYKFVLAKDAAMTQIVAEAEVPTTTYEYNGTLDYSTNYFWRVMALDPAPSDWSATFSFQTKSQP